MSLYVVCCTFSPSLPLSAYVWRSACLQRPEKDMQCFPLSFSNILLSDRASQGTWSSLCQAGWLATERVPKICLSSTSSVLEFRSLASTPASYGYGRLELRSKHLPNKNSHPPNRSLDLHRVSLSVTRAFPWNMHILSPTPGFLVQVWVICGVIGTKWSPPDIWEHAGSQEAGLTLAICVTLNQSLTVSGPNWFWSLSIFASKHQSFEKFISWDWTQARNPVLTLEYTTCLVISMAERSCTQRGVLPPWGVFIRCVCQP